MLRSWRRRADAVRPPVGRCEVSRDGAAGSSAAGVADNLGALSPPAEEAWRGRLPYGYRVTQNTAEEAAKRIEGRFRPRPRCPPPMPPPRCRPRSRRRRRRRPWLASRLPPWRRRPSYLRAALRPSRPSLPSRRPLSRPLP